MSKILLSAAMAALIFPLAAQAEQLQASAGIFNGTGYSDSYIGAGGYTELYNQALGELVDGGNGAFDAFGFYNSGVGELSQSRRVELLSGNVFRFFDTFTNNGSSTVQTTLNFFGNLGSDGDELVSVDAGGLLVSCLDDGSGACVDQPVLALVSGNKGLGVVKFSPDRYNVGFSVSLSAGQSISLLNFAFLASDVNGPTEQDLALAQTTGLSLLNAPRLQGLSAEQIASIANFNVSAVPEPSNWLMMALGLLALGARRTRKAQVAAV